MTADAHDDRLRIERARQLAFDPGEIDATADAQARRTPRQLVQIHDGGAMPAAANRVFLGHPAAIGGGEDEGATPAFSVDTSRSIPVLVIGSRVPAVGDLLTASSVSGRWVAELGGGSPSLACWPCAIPQTNLAVSWVNPILGDGSATLTFTPPGQWASACVHGLVFSLACPAGIVQFRVTYFLSGECPSGLSQECSSAGGPPFSLRLDAYSCDPLYLRYTLTAANCPFLAAGGYQTFIISE
jgi:hypothetical protein